MNHTAKYAALSGLLFVAASGACALGFGIAAGSFARAPAPGKADTEVAARLTHGAPQSPLLGSDPERVAEQTESHANWVEVVDAVNMRQGPSSASSVIKVQIEGTKLKVASRDGKWVEVVEPETGGTGWVFDKFVKPAEPASRRAEAAETAIR